MSFCFIVYFCLFMFVCLSFWLIIFAFPKCFIIRIHVDRSRPNPQTSSWNEVELPPKVEAPTGDPSRHSQSEEASTAIPVVLSNYNPVPSRRTEAAYRVHPNTRYWLCNWVPDAVTPLSAGRRRGVICASITSWGLRALGGGGSVVFQFTLGYRPVVLPFVRPGGVGVRKKGGI